MSGLAAHGGVPTAIRGPWLNVSKPGGTCLMLVSQSILKVISSNDEQMNTHQAIRNGHGNLIAGVRDHECFSRDQN